MDQIHEDLLINFEFDSFHHDDDATLQSKLQRQRKTISMVKKRIVTTDSLIKKYYTKNVAYDEIEKNLFDSRNECKQLFKEKIDFQNSVLQLENERAGLLKDIKILENKIRHQEHCQSALNSNVDQLQTLSKEFELKYEAEALENKMKTLSIKEKDNEINLLRKDFDLLLQHLRFSCNIIRKKDKLPKRLQSMVLKKYKCNKTIDIEVSEDEIGSIYECVEQETQHLSKLTESGNLVTDIKHKAERVDFDSEGSNDVVCSEDTGRGSSVAFFSDSDKYSSPDYSSNTSPIHPDQLTFKIPTRKEDKASSPIHFQDDRQLICSKCSSSIYAQDHHLFSNPLITNDNARTSSIINEPKEQYIKSNPTVIISDYDKKPANDSIFDENPDDDPNPDEDTYVGDDHPYLDDDPMQDDESNNVVQSSSKEHKEQLCLELNNNSNNNDIDEDSEIRNIFRTMALHHNLITPLPNSPRTVRPTIQINSDHNKHTAQYEFMNVLSRNNNMLETCSNQLNENQNIMKKLFEIIESLGTKPDMINTLNSVQNNMNTHQVAIEGTRNTKQPLEECYKNDISAASISASCENETSAASISAKHLNQGNVSACGVSSILNDSEGNVDDVTENVHLKDISDEEIVFVIVPDENIDLEKVVEETSQQEIQNKTKSKIVESIIYEDTELDATTVNSAVNDTVTPDVNETFDCETAPNAETTSKFEKQCKRKIILSKLEKLRSKIVQKKNKIKYAELPPRKLRNRIISKQPVDKNKAIHCDSIADRNDKDAYEKALAVVAEVRDKQKRKEHCGNKLHIIRQKDAPINPKKIIKVSRMTRSQSFNTKSFLDQHKNIPEQKNCKNNMNRLDIKNNNNKNCDNIKNNNNKNSDNDIQKSSEMSVDRSPTGSAQKRSASTVDNSVNRRILRSSGVNVTSTSNHNCSVEDTQTQRKRRRYSDSKDNIRITRNSDHVRDISGRQKTEYSDLEIFDSRAVNEIPCGQNEHNTTENNKNPVTDQENRQPKKSPKTGYHHMQDSILCRMIDKNGTENSIFTSGNRYDNNRNPCYIKLLKGVQRIVESQSNDAKDEMNKLVDELCKHTVQEFTAGFVKYLRDPERKAEMFNKMSIPSAPKMTRTEQILIYIVNKLNSYWAEGELIEAVFRYIEYNLFRLNMTPDFDVIDSLSHFYALLCRYHRYKNRLRQFVLDAMYSMNYKAVAVLRQCINVWFHIIPLAHMSQAKSPLVVCLVYLLHFHRCDDRLKIVEETRNILQKKYYYDLSDWNEAKIVDYIKTCILEVKDIPTEQKLLRTAIIILSKRKGPEWCQKSIIKNILLPTINDEKSPSWLREFCVSLLGPLMKPFPANMMINCEIVVNQLFDMLEDNNCSQRMREAIYTSLTYCSKRCLSRVIRSLLSWQPETVSPEFESVLEDYVRSRRIHCWRKLIKQNAQ